MPMSKLAQKIALVVRGGLEGRDVLPGNDEDVDRGLGMDVPEGHHAVVLVDHGGGDFA